jgi:hypothetical protein
MSKIKKTFSIYSQAFYAKPEIEYLEGREEIVGGVHWKLPGRTLYRRDYGDVKGLFHDEITIHYDDHGAGLHLEIDVVWFVDKGENVPTLLNREVVLQLPDSDAKSLLRSLNVMDNYSPRQLAAELVTLGFSDKTLRRLEDRYEVEDEDEDEDAGEN